MRLESPRTSHEPLTDPAELALLEPWRDAVRRATTAVGLIELPSTRIVELSPAARSLVGHDTETGLDLVDPEKRREAATINRAAVSGAIDGAEYRRRRWRRRDGSVVEVTVRARAIRLGSRTYAVCVARDVADPSPRPTDPVVYWPVEDDRPPTVVTKLDEQWRVLALDGDGSLLGDPAPHGATITTLVHPADLAGLVFAFAGATTHVGASTSLRLVAGADLVPVQAHVSRIQDRAWRVAFAPATSGVPRHHPVARRVSELEDSLRRIARELQESGVVATAGADVLRVTGVNELPERQREIVVRLARGERVGTIAAGMYLSANTVRNHLTAVFRKFGVHSQEELLAILHGAERDRPPSET